MLNDTELAEEQTTPEPFRGMSKTAIYKLLSRDFILPDCDSRCCNKAYLFEVFSDKVFRVSRSDLLLFESSLLPEESLKAPFFNMSVLKIRIDKLMKLMNLKPFGFSQGKLPDEMWFSRILRYLDRSNILRAFKKPVKNSKVPRNIAGRM